MAELRSRRPDLPVVFDVYGRGDAEPVLTALAAELGVADRVVSTAGSARRRGREAGGRGHRVSPIQRNAFGEISMPTKALEYAIMGKPVVAADLPTARQHFDADMLAWYDSGDPTSLADALLRLVDDPSPATVPWSGRPSGPRAVVGRERRRTPRSSARSRGGSRSGADLTSGRNRSSIRVSRAPVRPAP